MDTDEFDESEPIIEPYRDGKVHVMREKCNTCVFRPGNLVNLSPGRLKGMSDDVKESGIPFSCHQTLPYWGDHYVAHYGGAALCRGAIDAHDPAILHLAEQMNVLVEVEPYRED